MRKETQFGITINTANMPIMGRKTRFERRLQGKAWELLAEKVKNTTDDSEKDKLLTKISRRFI